MTSQEKREAARRLRAEAEKIRREGFTNLFEHTITCILYGQVPKDRAEDRCGLCPIRPFVPPEYQEETFACQHVTADGWDAALAHPDLVEQVIASFLRNAALLEAEADAAEAQGRNGPVS